MEPDPLATEWRPTALRHGRKAKRHSTLAKNIGVSDIAEGRKNRAEVQKPRRQTERQTERQTDRDRDRDRETDRERERDRLSMGV